MIRRTATAFLVAMLVATSVAGATGTGQTNAAVADTQLTPDDVLLEVALDENGSATWTVEYRIRLDDDNDTAAFESVQSDIQENESQFARPFGDRMRATAADAENATGRQMSIENVSVTAERRQIPQEYGVVAYRFRWIGFAQANETSIRAGDALSGFFLDNQTSLLLSWPSGYDLDSASPTPTETREQSVVWVGPTDFATGEPRIVLSERTGGDGPTPATTTGGTNRGLSPLMLGLAVVALAVLAAVGVVYRRGGLSAGESASTGESDTATEPAATTAEPTAPAAGDDATEAESPDSGPAEAPPEELLSNEERVLRLIQQRGGRMKQQEVAQALDWTDAKTSQVVRKMRDGGDLEAFRLGRENVLSLPDEGDGDE